MEDTNTSVQASAQPEDLVPPTEWNPEFGRRVAAAITRLDDKQSAVEMLITEVRARMASKDDVQSLKNAIASFKPAEGSLPRSGLPSTPGLTAADPSPVLASASLPVSSTPAALPLPGIPLSLAGADCANLRRILPLPQKFEKVSADYDFTLWLTSMQEYLTLAGFPNAQWAVVASYYLAQAPLRLWQSHKAQLLANGNNAVYDWDYFKQWCLNSFCLYDYKQRAIEQLHQLRQLGSVADYKSEYDALVAQTALPMEARMFFWNRGLKSNVRAACNLDPNTHSAFRDISRAQKAALAFDFSTYYTEHTWDVPTRHRDTAHHHNLDAYDGEPRASAPDSTAPHMSAARKRKCYNCGDAGHFAADCPKPASQSNADASAEATAS